MAPDISGGHIDAHRPRAGADGRSLEPAAPFRYLNHSCEPNCELFFWETDEPAPLDRSWLQALRPIDPGEELTIDYAWPADAAIPCGCGAARLPRLDRVSGRAGPIGARRIGMSDVEPGGRVADYLPRITNVGGMEPLDRLLGSGPEAFAASCCSSAKMRVTFVASTGCRFVLGLPLVVINALSPIAGVKEDFGPGRLPAEPHRLISATETVGLR